MNYTIDTELLSIDIETLSIHCIHICIGLLPACDKCGVLAERSKRWFSDYYWFKVYKRDEMESPNEKAGLKSCE